MITIPIVEPHAKKKIRAFARHMEITKEQAGFIDYMRVHYIGWEHDYIKKPPKGHEITGAE